MRYLTFPISGGELPPPLFYSLIRTSQKILFLVAMFLQVCLANDTKDEDRPKVMYFNIPPQSAQGSLAKLAAQADLSYFVSLDLISSIRTNPVVGYYTVNDALRILLHNTDLLAEISDDGQLKLQNIGIAQSGQPQDELVKKVQYLEEIAVTGFRNSLVLSTEIKRNASIIKEVVTEETLGKMPDSNVAESLQRLPGVLIERRDGQGTKIRVRGFDQNIIMLDGETLISGMEYFKMGWNEREYENSFESIPVELLHRLEIYKTPSASHIEGSIGGAIDLITRSGFDMDEPVMMGELKADYGKYSESAQPTGFVLFGKNWNDKVAAVAHFIGHKQISHTDQFDAFAVGGKIWETWYEEPSATYLAPNEITFADTEQDRERFGGTLNTGYKPTENLELTFEWFGIDANIKGRSYSVWHELGDVTETEPDSPFIIDNSRDIGVIKSGTFDNIIALVTTTGETSDIKADNFKIKMDFDLNESWNIFSQLYRSHSKTIHRSGNTNSAVTVHTYSLPVWVNDTSISPTGWQILGHDCGSCNAAVSSIYTNDYPVPQVRYADPDRLVNRDDIIFTDQRASGSNTGQDAWSFRADIEYNPGWWNGIESIKAGVRISDKKINSNAYKYLTDFSQTLGAASPTRFNSDGTILETSNFDPTRPPTAQNIGLQNATYYDLCNNGGLPEGEICDIDGDGLDDNHPYGPMVYSINADTDILSNTLTTSSGEFLAHHLYGEPFSASDSFFGTSVFEWFLPGFQPWQRYEDNPSLYRTIDNFFPSGGYQSTLTIADHTKIWDDVGKWIDSAAPGAPVNLVKVPRDSWRVKEHTSAFYIEGDYRHPNLPLNINLGLRTVKTEMEITTATISNDVKYSLTQEDWYLSGLGGGWVLETKSQSYWNHLPSINLTWDLNEDTKLRVSGVKTIARPSARELGEGLFPIFRENVDEFGRPFQKFVGGTAGNSGLQPYKVTQGDIAIEYYGSRPDFVSLGYFWKDINSFISTRSEIESWFDESPSGRSEGSVTRPYNTEAGIVRGFELAFQKSWNNGLGVNANYTYTNSKYSDSPFTDRDFYFPGVSNDSANVIGFYQTDDISIRLAYSWRNEFLSPYRESISVSRSFSQNRYRLAEIHDDTEQWDARILWNFRPELALSLELINITGESQSSYLEYKNIPASYSNSEPRVILGIKFEI